MTILTAVTLLFPTGRSAAATPGRATERGGVSAPGLAVAVAVIVVVIGIVVSGAHEIIWDAMTGAVDAVTG